MTERKGCQKQKCREVGVSDGDRFWQKKRGGREEVAVQTIVSCVLQKSYKFVIFSWRSEGEQATECM